MGEEGLPRDGIGFGLGRGDSEKRGELGSKEWLQTALVDRVNILRSSKGRLLGAAAVLVLLVAGGYFLLRPEPAPPVVPRALPVEAPSQTTLRPTPSAGSAGSAGSTPSVGEEMFVHAAGAVQNPGVYRFAGGARVVDLLFAAGGVAPNADLGRVNLASLLSDGSQIFFPFVGKDPPSLTVGSSAEADSETSGPLDINTAAASALQDLPGVGPVIAAAIEEHRKNNGPYDSVESLLKVSGIGPAKLEQLRPHVSVSS